MAFEITTDVWIPFRVVDADGDGVTGQNAAALSGMKFKQLTQSGTTSTAFTEVDTGAADYEVNDLGEGDYEVMIPGSGGATANNNTAGICWVNGAATGGKFVPVFVEIIDPANADLLALFLSIIDQSTGQIDSGSFAAGAITRAALATDLQGAIAPISVTIGGTGNDTTHLHLSGLTYADDELNGKYAAWYDNSATEWHIIRVTDWVLSTALATVELWPSGGVLPATPENSVDRCVVLANSPMSDLYEWLSGTPLALSSSRPPVQIGGLDADVVQNSHLADNLIAAEQFAADAITAAKIAAGAIDAATFAADVDAEILSYIVDDATRIDASALNTATVTTVPAILDDTDLIDDATSGLAKIATDVAAVLVDTATTLQGELDGIQADTEDIQTRLPAALVSGRIDASVGAMAADVMTAAAAAADLGTELATAVWASGTRTLTALGAGVIASGTIVSDELNNIADALLKRDWTAVTGEASRSALNALRFLRNKFVISSGTLSVKEEDDTTEAWNATVTTGARDAITEVDPS